MVGDIYIYNHPIGKKNTYISGIVLANWVIICYLPETGNSIELVTQYQSRHRVRVVLPELGGLFHLLKGDLLYNPLTPWKINMEPENHQFEKGNHLPNLHFWVPC